MTFVAFDKEATKTAKRIIRDALNGRKYHLLEASWTRGTKEVLNDDHSVTEEPDGTWIIRFKVEEKCRKKRK